MITRGTADAECGLLWGESWIRSGSAEELDVFDGDGQKSGTGRCGSHDGSEEQGDQNLKEKIIQLKNFYYFK